MGAVIGNGGTLGANWFVNNTPNTLATLSLMSNTIFDKQNRTVTGVTTITGRINVKMTGGGEHCQLQGGLTGSGHVTFSGSGMVIVPWQVVSMVSVTEGVHVQYV